MRRYDAKKGENFLKIFSGLKMHTFSELYDFIQKSVKKISKKVAEKFAGKKKSRTFATRLRNNGKFIDKFEKR